MDKKIEKIVRSYLNDGNYRGGYEEYIAEVETMRNELEDLFIAEKQELKKKVLETIGNTSFVDWEVYKGNEAQYQFATIISEKIRRLGDE